MSSKKVDFKVVGIALLPATGVSITVILLGQLLGLPESTAERISQILFFPIFLAVCNTSGRIHPLKPADGQAAKKASEKSSG
jgi:hypothetical protein